MDISPSDFFSNLELLCHNCGMRQKGAPALYSKRFLQLVYSLQLYLYRQHNHNRKKQFFLSPLYGGGGKRTCCFDIHLNIRADSLHRKTTWRAVLLWWMMMDDRAIKMFNSISQPSLSFFVSNWTGCSGFSVKKERKKEITFLLL